MFRHRRQAEYGVLEVRAQDRARHRDRVIVVLGDVRVLGLVPVVIPGGDDIFGVVKEEHEQVVVGRDRLAIRPARILVEPDVNGAFLWHDGPGIGQSRIESIG